MELHMRCVPLSLAAVLALAACTSLDRSRDLGNPAVPGVVLAAQVCSLCHGVDGNSVSPAFPRLAGQQATYLKNQLQSFRSHHRADPAGSEYMWGLSHHLTDQQIEALAEYYSRQVPHDYRRSFDAKLLAEGKSIFEQGAPSRNVIACSACHGHNGQGIDAFPRLAHQHADYLVKQLYVFQYTQGRPGTPMTTVSHPLTGLNKEAVAAFLEAFPD
jgi:cytochrome c553